MKPLSIEESEQVFGGAMPYISDVLIVGMTAYAISFPVEMMANATWVTPSLEDYVPTVDTAIAVTASIVGFVAAEALALCILELHRPGYWLGILKPRQ
jgi:hypothetical protein